MTGQNTMAQVQAGQNLWRAPWIALSSTCSPKDTLVYIQVRVRVTSPSQRQLYTEAPIESLPVLMRLF